MSNLIRWEPAREMMTLREAMDHLFDDAFTRPLAVNGGWRGAGTALFAAGGLPGATRGAGGDAASGALFAAGFASAGFGVGAFASGGLVSGRGALSSRSLGASGMSLSVAGAALALDT